MFKFSLGQKVYVVKDKIEKDRSKKVECYYCSGSGNCSEYDASNNLYETICYNCDGTGEAYSDSRVYWAGETFITAILLSGTQESQKVEYYFKKHKLPSVEENVFENEEEAVKKCKELNNTNV